MAVEKQVKNIDGVMDATVDFVSKKLIIEVKHKRELPRIVEEATKIAIRIESGIKVVDMEEHKKKDGNADDTAKAEKIN